MKKTIITTMLALVALTGQAQDKLIRVDNESTISRKTNSQRVMYENEKARLLMPEVFKEEKEVKTCRIGKK